MAQFVFDLSLPPALGPEDFIVADSNREAAGWIARWPDWPGPVLALHGAPGAGKSHLLGIWAQRAGARGLAGGALAATDPAELGAAGAVALDDADRVAGDAAAERALFH
ncbi:DNA replication protein, partial [Inquilinus sp. YAF38]